jgi:hypothetical protein
MMGEIFKFFGAETFEPGAELLRLHADIVLGRFKVERLIGKESVTALFDPLHGALYHAAAESVRVNRGGNAPGKILKICGDKLMHVHVEQGTVKIKQNGVYFAEFRHDVLRRVEGCTLAL